MTTSTNERKKNTNTKYTMHENYVSHRIFIATIYSNQTFLAECLFCSFGTVRFVSFCIYCQTPQTLNISKCFTLHAITLDNVRIFARVRDHFHMQASLFIHIEWISTTTAITCDLPSQILHVQRYIHLSLFQVKI